MWEVFPVFKSVICSNDCVYVCVDVWCVVRHILSGSLPPASQCEQHQHQHNHHRGERWAVSLPCKRVPLSSLLDFKQAWNCMPDVQRCWAVFVFVFQVRVILPYLGPPSESVVVKMIPNERLPPRNLHKVQVDKTQAILKWQPPYDSPSSPLVCIWMNTALSFGLLKGIKSTDAGQ